MTKRQRRICRIIIKKKRLPLILEKSGITDYLELQEEIGPNNLDFSDCRMDENTVVTLENVLIEELEAYQWNIFRSCFTWALSVCALVISLIALFRS